MSTTLAMDDVCGRHGVQLYRTPVGEVNVVAEMQRVGAVDLLEGKRRALARHRSAVAAIVEALEGADGRPAGGATAADAPSPGMSRVVLNAQEDLRREIARTMHDGPAQSLTNIVLQAEIVERPLERSPDQAKAELRLLVSMVQQTLDATKTFIFDVRPMVLDDLGLVPTLRRTARDRSRTARLPVEFDSVDPDRRLGPDLESAVFRMIDDAVSGYLATTPARVAVRLEWTEAGMRGEVRGVRSDVALMTLAAGEALAAMADEERAAGAGADVPPALAERGVRRLAERALDTDALVALGVAAAYVISARSVLAGGGPLYLDTAMGILLFVTIGRYLEAAARARTTDALAALASRMPQRARRVAEDGSEAEVEIGALRLGDRVRVRPGETIPADGVVVRGEAAVTEAEITGEPLPVTRGPGDQVSACTVALDGALDVEVRRVGDDTTVARIVRLVGEARAGR